MKHLNWCFESQSPCELYELLRSEFGEIAILEFGSEIAGVYREEYDEDDRLFSFPVESRIDSTLAALSIRIWLASGEEAMVTFDEIGCLSL